MPPRTFEARRFLVVVVALERGARVRVDDLADRFLGVQEAAVGVEPRARALLPGLRVVDRDVVVGRAQRAVGHRRVAADDDDSFRRAVAVAHGALESLGERADVGLGRLVAERELERRARVVR